MLAMGARQPSEGGMDSEVDRTIWPSFQDVMTTFLADTLARTHSTTEAVVLRLRRCVCWLALVIAVSEVGHGNRYLAHPTFTVSRAREVNQTLGALVMWLHYFCRHSALALSTQVGTKTALCGRTCLSHVVCIACTLCTRALSETNSGCKCACGTCRRPKRTASIVSAMPCLGSLLTTWPAIARVGSSSKAQALGVGMCGVIVWCVWGVWFTRRRAACACSYPEWLCTLFDAYGTTTGDAPASVAVLWNGRRFMADFGSLSCQLLPRRPADAGLLPTASNKAAGSGMPSVPVNRINDDNPTTSELSNMRVCGMRHVSVADGATAAAATKAEAMIRTTLAVSFRPHERRQAWTTIAAHQLGVARQAIGPAAAVPARRALVALRQAMKTLPAAALAATRCEAPSLQGGTCSKGDDGGGGMLGLMMAEANIITARARQSSIQSMIHETAKAIIMSLVEAIDWCCFYFQRRELLVDAIDAAVAVDASALTVDKPTAGLLLAARLWAQARQLLQTYALQLRKYDAEVRPGVQCCALATVLSATR